MPFGMGFSSSEDRVICLDQGWLSCKQVASPIQVKPFIRAPRVFATPAPGHPRQCALGLQSKMEHRARDFEMGR